MRRFCFLSIYLSIAFAVLVPQGRGQQAEMTTEDSIKLYSEWRFKLSGLKKYTPEELDSMTLAGLAKAAVATLPAPVAEMQENDPRTDTMRSVQSERTSWINIRKNEYNTAVEPMIAISPADDGNFITGFMESDGVSFHPKTAYTFGAGRRWSQADIPTSWLRYRGQSDACVAFGTDGDAWFSYMDYTDGIKSSPGAIIVCRSLNGGQSWDQQYVALEDDSIKATLFYDKPWLTVDQSGSQYRNTVYVSATRFSFYKRATQIIVLHKRADSTAFTEPIGISPILPDSMACQGSQIIVGPDSAVYVFWISFNLRTMIGSMWMAKSTNGGLTFGSPKELTVLGPVHLVNSHIRYAKAVTLPTVAMRRTVGSGFEFCLAWADWNGTRSDVIFSKSSDKGQSWTLPVPIDGLQNAFLPSLAVDLAGRIIVAYIASNDTSAALVNLRIAESIDGGQIFHGSDTYNGAYSGNVTFLGEYIGVAANRYTYWAVFPAYVGEGRTMGQPINNIGGSYRAVTPTVKNDLPAAQSRYVWYDGIRRNSPYTAPYGLADVNGLKDIAGTRILIRPSDSIQNGGTLKLFDRWVDGDDALVSSSKTTYVPIENRTYVAKFSSMAEVSVRNEFMDPSGSIRHGGILSFNHQQFDTDTLNGSLDTLISTSQAHALEAVDQLYSGYFRGFNAISNLVGGWRLPEDRVIVSRAFSATLQPGVYTAKFRNRYDFNLETPIFLDGGSGGSYSVDGINHGSSWLNGTAWQYDTTLLIAEDVGGFSCIGWSDGKTEAVRRFSLTDNTALRAYYKRFMTTNRADAIGTLGESRFLRSTDGWFHSLYADGAGLFRSSIRYLDDPTPSELPVSFLLSAGHKISTASFAAPHTGDPSWVTSVYTESYPDSGGWRHRIKWNGAPALDTSIAGVFARFSADVLGEYITQSETPASVPSAELWGTSTEPWIIASWLSGNDHDSTTDILFCVGRKPPTPFASPAQFYNLFDLRYLFSGFGDPRNLVMHIQQTISNYRIHLVWEEDAGIMAAEVAFSNSVMPASVSQIQVIRQPVMIAANNGQLERNVNPVMRMDGSGRVVIGWICRNLVDNSSKVRVGWRRSDDIGLSSNVNGVDSPSDVGGSQVSGVQISSLSMAAYPPESGREFDVTVAYVANGVRVAEYMVQNSAGDWHMPFLVKESQNDIGAVLEYSQTNVGSLQILCMSNVDEQGYYHLNIRTAEPELPVVAQAAFGAGWNLVSVPLAGTGFAPLDIYPGATSAPYGYFHGYTVPELLVPGSGYWFKFPASRTVDFRGSSLAHQSVQLYSGWNLVGSLSDQLPIDNIVPPMPLNSEFYDYVNGSYVGAPNIQPGKGYWVKSSVDQVITLDLHTQGTGGHVHIETAPPCGPDTTVPIPPTLLYPVSGSDWQPATLKFYWTPGRCQGIYQFQLATTSNFSSGVVTNTFLTAESIQVSGLISGTQYYWRVRDSIPPLISGWSTVNSVRAAAPPTPTLIFPANCSTNQPLSPSLGWGSAGGAVKYQIQVTNGSGTVILDDSSLTGLTKTVSNLSMGTNYTWKVRASNGSWWSAWTSAWTFTTGAPPVQPVLVFPAANAVSTLADITFRWNTAPGTTNYRLQVSTSAAFNGLTVDDSTLTDTSRLVQALQNLYTYYWRVNASNAFGTSAWSGARSFTVGIPPAAPTLSSPANASTNVVLNPTLSWSAVSGNTNYQLQLSKYVGFDSIALEYDNYTSTSKQTDYLDGNTRYYWRVCARNVGGTSAWSTAWYFNTQASPVPPAPTLSAPANNATNIGIGGTPLIWNAALYATSYRVQAATSSNFASGMVLNHLQSELTYNDWDLLQASTTYYWRVQAINVSGTSSWSTTWQFTVTAGGGGCGGSLMAESSQMDAVTVTDAAGMSQTLYFYNGMDSLSQELNRANEMPPEPVKGAFSVRFETGKFFESLHPDKGRKGLPHIRVKGAKFPVTMDWDIKDRNKMDYWMPHPDNRRNRIRLHRRGRVGINQQETAGAVTLALDAEANSTCVPPPDPEKTVHRAIDDGNNDALPKEFSLAQNVPNPFNPSTVINYELPVDAKVELKVYNMLGQEVAVLADQVESAGYHAVTFNASNVASGVYFYRFKAEQVNAVTPQIYSRIIKMVVLK